MSVLRIGERFDRYELQGLIGTGGMARVFRAYDARLDRRVALKVLTDDALLSKTGAARMLREARAAASLEHPNVVSIYDVGEVEGTAFIAMEYVVGRSLRTFVGDPSVSNEQKLVWLVDVGKALAAAHARGLVHRDVKPENVMIREDGAVKVLDFGIARRAHGDTDRVTERDMLVGTPLYMAPEQMCGEALDVRADQYAFGVMAYELLAGVFPWRGVVEPMALIARILTTPPRPLREIAPNVPEAACDVIMRCFSRAPADRFPSMDEVVSALSLLTTGFSTHRTLRPPLLRGSAVRLSFALAIVLAAALATLLVVRARANRPVVAATSPSVAGGRPMAMTDAEPPTSKSAEAVAAYLAGLEQFREASVMNAIASLEQATRLDPTFAAAHLRLSSWASGINGALAREHLRVAQSYRSALPPRDQELLDVQSLSLSAEEHRFERAVARAQTAVQAHEGDAELVYRLALARDDVGDLRGAIAAADEAVRIDPRFAAAVWHRAVVQANLGELDDATRSIQACLAISPSAASCLRVRAFVHAVRGECPRLVEDARAMLVVEGGERAYERLAQGLAATGAPVSQIEESLEQHWARLTDYSRRARVEPIDRARLQLFVGDFGVAKQRVRELSDLVDRDPTEEAHAAATSLLLDVAEETGDSAGALSIARDYFARRTGWIPWDTEALRSPYGRVLAILRRAGDLGDQEFEAKRAAWIAAAVAGGPPSGLVWYAAYAELADTADRARAAIAARDRFDLIPAYDVVVDTDGLDGKVFALAGDVDRALPYLRRAAASCSDLLDPIGHAHAHLRLGAILESKGLRDEACSEYRAVLTRWKDAKPRSITADEAAARTKALGCAS